jgi:hypothetical protein
MTLLGRQLIKYTVVRKASSQYLSGIDAYARRDRPTSTICRCLCSAGWFADAHENMTHDGRYLHVERMS